MAGLAECSDEVDDGGGEENEASGNDTSEPAEGSDNASDEESGNASEEELADEELEEEANEEVEETEGDAKEADGAEGLIVVRIDYRLLKTRDSSFGVGVGLSCGRGQQFWPTTPTEEQFAYGERLNVREA